MEKGIDILSVLAGVIFLFIEINALWAGKCDVALWGLAWLTFLLILTFVIAFMNAEIEHSREKIKIYNEFIHVLERIEKEE